MASRRLGSCPPSFASSFACPPPPPAAPRRSAPGYTFARDGALARACAGRALFAPRALAAAGADSRAAAAAADGLAATTARMPAAAAAAPAAAMATPAAAASVAPRRLVLGAADGRRAAGPACCRLCTGAPPPSDCLLKLRSSPHSRGPTGWGLCWSLSRRATPHIGASASAGCATTLTVSPLRLGPGLLPGNAAPRRGDDAPPVAPRGELPSCQLSAGVAATPVCAAGLRGGC